MLVDLLYRLAEKEDAIVGGLLAAALYVAAVLAFRWWNSATGRGTGRPGK